MELTILVVIPQLGVGGVETLPFTAGVYGEADVVENSRYNTITVTLANGNTIQFLHASRIDVVDGQRVEPNTVLGLTGNAGLGANGQIHLHVQARDANGNWINPHDVLGDGADPDYP
jgi:murein DD-endopeptidase MepM/ murein hydrolase activator NlpD